MYERPEARPIYPPGTPGVPVLSRYANLLFPRSHRRSSLTENSRTYKSHFLPHCKTNMTNNGDRGIFATPFYRRLFDDISR